MYQLVHKLCFIKKTYCSHGILQTILKFLEVLSLLLIQNQILRNMQDFCYSTTFLEEEGNIDFWFLPRELSIFTSENTEERGKDTKRTAPNILNLNFPDAKKLVLSIFLQKNIGGKGKENVLKNNLRFWADKEISLFNFRAYFRKKKCFVT